MLTADQIRVARALLRWTQAGLAKHAGISATSVRALENEKPCDYRISTMNAIETALASAGITVTPEGVIRKSTV